jgi:hypothetical protein
MRFTIARRLGLAPSSLIDGPPRFVWKDETRFKNLGTASDHEAAVLASFSVAVGRCAIAATPVGGGLPAQMTASDFRGILLQSSPTVDLTALLAACWALGVPVIHLSVFPLQNKRMHSVATRLGDRYAVLVGRDSKFPSQIAYFIAHELGHILSGHVLDSAALLDVEDPLQASEPDDEESAADRFALELLTGNPEPEIETSQDRFSATQLAQAAMAAAGPAHIDPGVIALCLAHQTGQWREAMGALKILPPGEVDVAAGINDLAGQQFEWDSISTENQAFLQTIMGGAARAA